MASTTTLTFVLTATDRASAVVGKIGDTFNRAAKDAGDWATTNSRALSTVSTGLMVTGAAAVAGVGLAVSKFADFDQAMSGVQAATMETAQGMGSLRSAALKAGADTQYSASEAAAAITDLAKAGVSTKDILGGGLTGALNLAAAAQMDVATAAENTATTLNQFGLQGKDASHVADLLAAASGKAMGEVSDMAGALKFVGPIAHQMGVSLEETTGTIAELAQQGILGEQAGTSLRGMLLALTSPSKVASAEMKQLGIEVYDLATHKFIGLAGVAEQMKTKMKGLTDAERDEAFGRIFGNEQITTARILYEGGAEKVKYWTKQVNDSGFAAEQARIKTDNLKGDLERLSGSIDTVVIKSGSGLNDMLRQMTQSAEGFVNQIGSMPPAVIQTGTLVAGVGSASALAVGGVGKLVVAVNSARTAASLMGTSLGAVSLAAGALGAVVGVAGFAFASWSAKQQKAKQRTDDFKTSLEQATGKITENTRAVALNNLEQDGMVDKARKLGIRMDDLVTASIDPSSLAMKRLQKASEDATAAWRKSQESDVNSGMGMQMSQQTMQAEQAVNGWKTVLGELGGQQDEVAKSQQRWKDEQEAGIKATDDSTAATEDNRTALQKVASGADMATTSTSNYVQALQDLIDAQQTAAGNAISEQDAQIKFQQALDDAAASVKENGKGLDINTQKGRDNKDALLGIATAGESVIKSMQANGAGQAALQAAMEQTRQSFITAATQFGMTKDQASAFADQLHLIPSEVSVAVAVDTANAQKAIDNFIGRNGSHQILIDVGGTMVRAGQVMARAGGGPVTAGRPYLVGERTAELFVPTQSGTVLNPGQIAAALQGADLGGSRGGTVNNYFSIYETVSAEATTMQVARRLQSMAV